MHKRSFFSYGKTGDHGWNWQTREMTISWLDSLGPLDFNNSLCTQCKIWQQITFLWCWCVFFFSRLPGEISISSSQKSSVAWAVEWSVTGGAGQGSLILFRGCLENFYPEDGTADRLRQSLRPRRQKHQGGGRGGVGGGGGQLASEPSSCRPTGARTPTGWSRSGWTRCGMTCGPASSRCTRGRAWPSRGTWNSTRILALPESSLSLLNGVWSSL